MPRIKPSYLKRKGWLPKQWEFNQDRLLDEAEKGQWLRSRKYEGKTRTFCNYAVNRGLAFHGTPGFRQKNPKNPEAINGFEPNDIRQTSKGANDIAETLKRSPTWYKISPDTAQELTNELGMATVAAYKNPNPKKSGHVALVRPDDGTGIESGNPLLSNIGTLNNTGVIRADKSWGPKFDYFASRRDSSLETALHRANFEMSPIYTGKLSSESRFLKDALERARDELHPSFEGPPSPMTRWVRDGLKFNPNKPSGSGPHNSLLKTLADRL